nr:hypothetical protein [Tanacetum cinerariifolium]
LFKTLCLLNYALMIRHDYDITSSLRRGVLQLWYQGQMVNTLTDADLSAAVQNALQTLLPQIRAEIREEFRTSSGPSDASGNPPPVRIHTWLERFNKFLGAAAGTEEEQAKNFQWGLRRQKSGDRHQPTTQQSSHRNHGHNNDRHGSDRRGGGDNHRSNNNYSDGRDQRNRGQQSHRSANSGNSS